MRILGTAVYYAGSYSRRLRHQLLAASLSSAERGVLHIYVSGFPEKINVHYTRHWQAGKVLYMDWYSAPHVTVPF